MESNHLLYNTGRSFKSTYVAHYLIALRAKLNDLSQAVEKKINYLSKQKHLKKCLINKALLLSQAEAHR